MNIDIELYRREVRIAPEPPGSVPGVRNAGGTPVPAPELVPGGGATAPAQPLVRLSAIDISPERPRRTLVFLHGFGGQAGQWRHQLQKFAEENRVIALDLPGHGRSDRLPGGYAMPEVQSALRAALDVLGVKGASVLVGHSFGGAVAATFAAENPGRVSHLVLMATAAEFRLSWPYRVALRVHSSVLRLVAPLTRQWLGARPDVMQLWYRQNMRDWRGERSSGSISTPTLVIRGTATVCSSAGLERCRCPFRARRRDIGASGHMVMIERREAANRAIERFLDGEGRISWREQGRSRPESGREALRTERPWLDHYEPGVPYTIGLPRVLVHHLLRSAVMRFPRKIAIRFEGSSIRYRRLNQEANRFANALLTLGVGKGARVVLLMPNVPQMVIGFFGTLKAGAVVVFIPPSPDPDEVVRQVAESQASVLVTMTPMSGLARKIRESAGVPHVVLTDPGEYLGPGKHWLSRWRNRGMDLAGALHWRSWLGGRSRKSPASDVSPDDLAVIQFTGGTTAEARGVMLAHRNLVANAFQTRHWLPDAVEGRESFLCVLPFSHSYGLTGTLTVPVTVGATMILKPVFNVHEVLKAIRRYRPTIFPGVPGMYVAINNFPGVRKYRVSSIRACISGSAPLPVEVQEAFEKLTKGRLVEGYGVTEASPVTHANPLDGLRKVGSIGVPLPSTEARVVNLKTGRKEVGIGQIGELAVRGPQVMLGYWKNAAATRQVITDEGWLLTGDVALVDADGYFRIVARKADMWYPTKPGKPAFPRDIEEVLYEIPQVKEAVVVAVGGAPVAFIIAAGERPKAETIIAYCKRRLPPTLVPKLVFFVDDFPRTFIGKVLRRELAKKVEEVSDFSHQSLSQTY
jgi:long-chain acyl-CoA synthetase